MEQKAILKMQGISKFYPGVVALNKVDLTVYKGEVHALLGENGAGKSTLIKVLSGAVKNDEGMIELDGQTFEHMTPLSAREHGVEVIYQEYNLIPGLTVAENVCLGAQMHGIVDMKQQVRVAQEIFDRYNINLDPKALVGSLPPAKQQLVEITKAISKDPKIIVMDEPTAQLTMAEVDNLYKIIAALKAKGTSIIFGRPVRDDREHVGDRQGSADHADGRKRAEVGGPEKQLRDRGSDPQSGTCQRLCERRLLL